MAVLEVPAQDDLGRGLLVVGGDAGDGRVFEGAAVVLGGQWPVDQEQVEIVEAEVLECLVEGASYVVGVVVAVAEFAGDV